jgi:hypothetical protein
MVNEQEPVKPTPSVALQTTVVAPFGNTAPLTPPLKWLATAPAQLSDAVGVGYATDALHWFKSLARTIFVGQIMVGAVASATVTVAEHVAVLLLPSLTVKTTVFVPKFAQVKAFGVTDTWFTVPQLSDPLWNTLNVVILAPPAALRLAVKFLQITVGSVPSTTVTVKEQVAVLLAASVAVSVTTWLPVIVVPATGLCALLGLAVQLSLAVAAAV